MKINDLKQSKIQLIFWGTYDTGKPRVRILLSGLRKNGVKIIECHSDVWSGIEDKSQISGWSTKLFILVKWLLSYPRLIINYLRLPQHKVVIVGYLGQLDVLVLWPFAKMRGAYIIWDAFLSIHDTMVNDRKLIGPRNPLACILYAWEWMACRAADVILLDTQAHANYFIKQFKLKADKCQRVFVGTEVTAFTPSTNCQECCEPDSMMTILFYGQFIPLHGIETIIAAAQLLKSNSIKWMIIGQGQEESKIRKLLDSNPVDNLEWISWVPYEELVNWIHKSHICLGIFGNSDKAERVIPNKVFQIIACGKPLITRDSPAIRELLNPEMVEVVLVPPQDPSALAAALSNFLKNYQCYEGKRLHGHVAKRIEPVAIGLQLIKIMNRFYVK